MRVKRPILMPLDLSATASGLEIEFRVIKPYCPAHKFCNDIHQFRRAHDVIKDLMLFVWIFNAPHNGSVGGVARTNVKYGVGSRYTSRRIDELLDRIANPRQGFIAE